VLLFLCPRIDATFTDALAGIDGFLKTTQGSGYGFAVQDVSDPKTLGKGAGIGFRKEDSGLRQKVDQVIDAMLKDGTYKRIEQKYFDIDIHGS
jgi:ABC-type amino acid transport substrate-binding protein